MQSHCENLLDRNSQTVCRWCRTLFQMDKKSLLADPLSNLTRPKALSMSRNATEQFLALLKNPKFFNDLRKELRFTTDGGSSALDVHMR